MTSRLIGSKPTGETKSFLSDNDSFESDLPRRGGKDTTSPTSAEYVKRTAKMFETVRTSESSSKTEVERRPSGASETKRMSNGDSPKIDEVDRGKKPSYLGVSCSNSGYRNVINYDSKLREGFWSTNQRESLVLGNHRLRDCSPLKFEPDFRSQNGHEQRQKRTGDVQPPSYKMEEFVNISTSTKTISTFRNREEPKCNGSSETWRKSSYTSLGISPRTLKSPEKNCNSFLRSINSFESNCRRSQGETYRRITTESVVCTPTNSIQQRIERLYGPGALAQGFYIHNSNTKTRPKGTDAEESSSRLSESINQSMKSSIESIPDLLPAAPEVVLPIEKFSPGEEMNGSLEDSSGEKNGRYFLKLLQKEINRLESLASFAESELENGENLPEEASGKLRAAAGKARLLVRQKLHQFEGLCQKNMNEKPGEQFPTTSEDLAGFWDMVMLQVVQVYGVFDEIEKLKKNNWKPLTPKEEANGTETVDAGKKTARRIAPSTASNEKAEMARKAREETRKKMMEERRRMMKELRENKVAGNDGDIEIFAK